jgi:hypothetical protein
MKQLFNHLRLKRAVQ